MQHAHASTPDAGKVIWATPERTAAAHTGADLAATTAMFRGATGSCPACGIGRLFAGWLRVTAECAACGASLGTIRADDAPPYFTVFIVAHLVIGLQIALERFCTLSVATEMAIFLPGTLLLTLALIRPVKGATIGLMLKLGFMKPEDAVAEPATAKGRRDA